MASAFVNENAEIAVLMCLLTMPAKKSTISQLTEDDFYKPEHKRIFKAMQNLYLEDKDVDMVTVSGKMVEMYGQNEKKLTDHVVQIITSTAAMEAWALGSHIETLKTCAMRRRVYMVIKETQTALEDDANDVTSVLEKVRHQLRDVVITKHAWQPISDVMMETYNAIEKKAKGEEQSMPSGISSMDSATTGFHAGEFTIVGARPAVGKSALGAQIALSTARNGYKVGIVSREMSPVQYGTRIIAHGSDVDAKKLRKGQLDPDDWVQIAHAVSLFNNANISFMFTAKFVEDLRMEVQKKIDTDGLDMLVVDYVQLLQTRQKFDKDYQRIGYISKMLKDMTVDFGISIIGLAQVNRSSENTMPTLAELRGSGDLEQDADNVIFMHRPKDVNDTCIFPQDKQLFESLKGSGNQYMMLKVAKQRQGETGMIATIFNPTRMRFTAIQRQQQAPALPQRQPEEDEE